MSDRLRVDRRELLGARRGDEPPPAANDERVTHDGAQTREGGAEAMVAQAYANDRRSLKELGPVGRWTRGRVMMPLFASFIERALNKVYSAPLNAPW